MTKILVACALGVTILAPALVSAEGQNTMGSAGVAAITRLENEGVKASLANDPSFYEKNLASDYTGGTSQGTWDTKASTIADMKDAQNNKTTSMELRDLKVRVHGDLGIATYSMPYDAMIKGQHYTRTVLCTDTWQQQSGTWKLMAGHCSEAAK